MVRLADFAPSVPVIRTAYEPREKVAISFHGKQGRTKQSFKAECDVNTIVKRYQKEGILTHVNSRVGSYSDLIGFSDYHTSLNQIIAAQNSFNSLPSTLRSRFRNDPAEFLAFTQNPENFDEMVKLGLAKEALSPRSTDSAVGERADGPDSSSEKASKPQKNKAVSPDAA